MALDVLEPQCAYINRPIFDFLFLILDSEFFFNVSCFLILNLEYQLQFRLQRWWPEEQATRRTDNYYQGFHDCVVQ